MMKRWLILLVMAFCMGSGTGRADDVLAVPDAWSFRIPDGYVHASFCGMHDGDVELALFPAQEDAPVLFWKVFSGRKDFVSDDDYAKESTARHCGHRGPTPEIVRNLSWLQDVAFHVSSGDYFQVFGDDVVSLFSISCGSKFCGTSQGIGYGSGGIVDEGLFARMSKKVVFLSRLDPYVKANAVFCVGHRRGEDAIYGFRQYVRTWVPKILSLGDGTFLVVLTGLNVADGGGGGRSILYPYVIRFDSKLSSPFFDEPRDVRMVAYDKLHQVMPWMDWGAICTDETCPDEIDTIQIKLRDILDQEP